MLKAIGSSEEFNVLSSFCVFLKTFFEARNEFDFKLFVNVDNMLCCPACFYGN